MEGQQGPIDCNTVGRGQAVRAATACFFLAVFIGSVVLGAVAPAWAYSRDNATFYDGLQDLSGFYARESVVLDTLGGVRLATDGAPVTTSWDGTAAFSGNLSWPIVGLSTLSTTEPGILQLLSTPFSLTRDLINPSIVASFDESTDASDSYGVQAMAVIKVSGLFKMYYTGYPASEFAQRIFLATATDGKNWTRAPGALTGGSVLDVGAAGDFDSRQVYRPYVAYDATRAAEGAADAYRMWYSAENESGGYIGLAASADSLNWTKYTEDGTFTPGATTVAVLRPGPPGSIDSYSVSEPAVLFDNNIYKMWYTASDGNNLRMGYATSTDGIHWEKGGRVLGLGGGGNDSEGFYGPTVWRTGDASSTLRMVYTGRKLVSGADHAQKLINATSPDGINWNSGSIARNPGSSGAFDESNLLWARVLKDESHAVSADDYVMWYTGNSSSGDTADPRNRVGAATGAGGSFSHGVDGPMQGGSVLDVGPLGTAFDSKDVYSPALVHAAASEPYLMLYTGRSGKDLKTRIGLATSPDRVDWTPETGTAFGGAVLSVGGAGAWDENGAGEPAVLFDATSSVLQMWYEGENAASPPLSKIGYAYASSAPGPWVKTGTALSGTSNKFDEHVAGQPSVIKDGSTYRMWYAGYSSRASFGKWEIGYASSTTTTAFTKYPNNSNPVPILMPSESYDVGGVLDPTVTNDESGVLRMVYTAVDGFGVSRLAYATSGDGLTWAKHGLVLPASEDPYEFDERGVAGASFFRDYASGENPPDLFITGIDRFGWRRIGRATASGPGFVPSGSAVFEYDAGKPQDWRRALVDQTVPANTGAEYEVSYFPTSSGFWSSYIPLTSEETFALPLSAEKVRWKVVMRRMDGAGEATTPVLNRLDIVHADVSYATTGVAVTVPVTMPAGRYLLNWDNVSVQAANVTSNTAVSVTVERLDGTPLLPPFPLDFSNQSGGSTNMSISAIPYWEQSLRLRFMLFGPDTDTPFLNGYSVAYRSTNVAPVSDLTATPGNGRIALGWTNPTYDGYAGTLVLRGESGFPTSYDDAGTATVHHTDASAVGLAEVIDATSLVNGRPYYYAIWTHNGSGEYSSAETTMQIPRPPVAAVGGLRAAAGDRRIALAWNKPTFGFYSGTRILRRSDTFPLSAFDAGAAVVYDATPAAALDTSGLANGTTYYYAAFAHNPFGDYSAAARVSATPKYNLSTFTLSLSGYRSYRRPYYNYLFGRAVGMYGYVKPPHKSVRVKVVIERYRYSRLRRRYVWGQAASVWRSMTTGGKYTYGYRPTVRGIYRARAFFPGDRDHFLRYAPGSKSYRMFKVR